MLKEWNDQGERTQEVRRVVELVGLSESATKRVSKLSGGQRRRVALAQSLLGDPRILILDEPTTGLDPTQRATLRRTLSTIATRCAVLLSTHQTEDVAALCERVVVLAGGTIRFDGAVLDLVAQAAGQVWLVDDETRIHRLRCRQLAHRHREVPGRRGPATARLGSRRAHAGGRLPPDARRPGGRRAALISSVCPTVSS